MCIQTVCCWLAIGFFLFLRCHTLWRDTAEGQQKEESTKNPHLTKIQGITPIKSKFCTFYIETGRWFNGRVVTTSHSQMKTYVGFDRALENSFSGNDFCEHLLDGEVFFRRHSEQSGCSYVFGGRRKTVYTNNNYSAHFHLFDSIGISSQACMWPKYLLIYSGRSTFLRRLSLLSAAVLSSVGICLYLLSVNNCSASVNSCNKGISWQLLNIFCLLFPQNILLHFHVQSYCDALPTLSTALK